MDWRYNTIWFDQIDPNKVAEISFKDPIPQDFGNLEYITLWRYKQPTPSLDWLPISKTARYFQVNLGGIKSLAGIGRLSSIRRLETHHCLKLESDFGLAEVAGTLRRLEIHLSRKFAIQGDLSPLLAHKNLRSVGFFNKRHYNIKTEEIDSKLKSKWPISNEELATKGQWKTFKYIGSEL
jgi:hypothetical protein